MVHPSYNSRERNVLGCPFDGETDDEGGFFGSCYTELDYRNKPKNATEKRTPKERCAPGYTGKLCAQCAEGYGMKKTGCEFCPSVAQMAGQGGSASFGLVFLIIFLVPRLRANKKLQELAVVVSRVAPSLVEDARIMIGVYQVFCSMGMTLNVRFPEDVERLIAWVKGYVSLDLFSLPGLSCLASSTTYYHKLYLQFLFPTVIMGGLYANYLWKRRPNMAKLKAMGHGDNPDHDAAVHARLNDHHKEKVCLNHAGFALRLCCLPT